MATVPAILIEREDTWDPQVFCGSILPVLQLKTENSWTPEAAEVIEGTRRDHDGHRQPVYRLSNVRGLELHLASDHCLPPVDAGNHCVGTGDLVVTKVVPIRAALVTSSVFRHPVDANCCLVRGLDLPLAFWMALCLNQPAFGEYVVRKSGAAIVPRVRAATLRSIRFPRPPAGVEGLSRRVYECLELRVDNQVELFRFLELVRGEVSSQLPDSTAEFAVDAEGHQMWHRFVDSADIDDSLVPEHVAVNGYQRRLKENAGWRSLVDLVSSRHIGGTRLGAVSTGIRTLRLSDVGDDLTVLKSEIRHDATATRRVYAEPLAKDEVLLSALVSCPSVVFVGTKPEPVVHPTDHWHRLRFRESPGAWAAVLNDPEVHRQLGRLAIGTIQQFAPLWAIQKLVLPDIGLQTRLNWDSSLRRWQKRRLELEADWVRLMAEAYRLLRETHRDCGPWTELPDALRGEEGWS